MRPVFEIRTVMRGVELLGLGFAIYLFYRSSRGHFEREIPRDETDEPATP